MIQVSETLWLTVDPIGRVVIGNDDRVVRIDIEEREQVIDFLLRADDYLDVQISGADSQREELMIDERALS